MNSPLRHMWGVVRDIVVLPPQVSVFEASYLRRMNRVAFWFFAAHIPAFTLVAFLNDTDPLFAASLTSLVMVGPLLARRAFAQRPRLQSVTAGFVAMVMGGLLVHFGQGPLQIEMHFYFFALIAMLAIFGNPVVVVVAAATVAGHHLLLWALVPQSVFNYDAPVWVVLVHAAFVVLESAATVFIARSFFDNVIGLEQIVAERTAEVKHKNDQLNMVLANIDQGLAIVGRDLRLSDERSGALGVWLGDGDNFDALIARADPRFAAVFGAGWSQVIDGFMPVEVCLAQLPTRLHRADGSTLGVRVTPIASDGDGDNDKFLLMVSDETARLASERLEREGRDVARAIDRLSHDRLGFLEYLDASDALVEALTARPPRLSDEVERRALHTLKGNSLLFGFESIADLCHDLESRRAEDPDPLRPAEQATLEERWRSLRRHLAPLTDQRDLPLIDAVDVRALTIAVARGDDRDSVLRQLESWEREPLRQRFARIGEQAQRLAERLDRGAVVIDIDDGGVRLDARRCAPLWSSFVHLVRNAVDHGLETPDQRRAAGKLEAPRISLQAREHDGTVDIAVADNGRGVDWRDVAARARALGQPHATRAEFVTVLFSDGFSTSDATTDISGRGVGLGAVRSVVVALGGDVTLESSPETGTRIVCTFPSVTTALPTTKPPAHTPEVHPWN